MAIKRKIPFKEINESFKDCEKFAELTQKNSDTNKAGKRSSVGKKTAKKSKTEPQPKAGKSTDADNVGNDEDEDLENFKNSYLLTMSQTFCGENAEESVSGSEYVFEPFAEVSFSFLKCLFLHKFYLFFGL